MPYHLRTPSTLNSAVGEVYYKGNNSWTEVFEDRKVYENESDATSEKNTTFSANGITYTPKHFANATVVSE